METPDFSKDEKARQLAVIFKEWCVRNERMVSYHLFSTLFNFDSGLAGSMYKDMLRYVQHYGLAVR